MALVKCPHGNWHQLDSVLLVENGREWSTFTSLPTPPGVRALWRTALGVANLRCEPEFVWLDSAHGAGGFFAPGLVAIGRQDIDAIVEMIWRQSVRELSPEEERLMRLFTPNSLIVRREDIWRHALAVIVAHELGHALRAQHGTASTGVAEEAGADHIAGQIGEALQSDATVERVVLHAIGCAGPETSCTHPSPDARVRAYDDGRAIQAHRRVSSQWWAGAQALVPQRAAFPPPLNALNLWL